MSGEQLDGGGVVGNCGDVTRLGATGPSDRLAKDGITAERLGVVSVDGAGMPTAARDGDSETLTAAPDVDELSGAGVCGTGRGGSVLPCVACAGPLGMCDGLVCALEVPIEVPAEGGWMERAVVVLVALFGGCLFCLSLTRWTRFVIVGAADVRFGRAALFCWDVLSANGGLSATWPDSWLSQHSTQHTEVSRRVK